MKMVHENVKWHNHVRMIIKKVLKYIGIFSKLRYYCPKTILVTLYYAFVYPHLIYCIEIWGNNIHTLTYLNPLLILQKKIVRIISFADYNSHTLPLFKKLKIMHIFDIYTFRISLLSPTHIYSKSSPINLQHLSLTINTHEHCTRSSTQRKFFVHRYRTSSFGISTISHKVTITWNSLPEDLTCIVNKRAFKSKLGSWLKENPTSYNYSIQKIPQRKLLFFGHSCVTKI
eukprot:Lithocolla_globosa_v1_NODE_7089_length_992_cov_64.610874.p1 type:complete len:229 gc:universal NODE_7089_length_992_cov_64.610874:246-932(+)